MSKEVKTQEQETPKSNKKYIVLALVAVLAVIGIVKNNVSNKETVVTSTAKPEVTANVIEKKPVEEPTIARIDISTPLINADEPQFEVYVNGSETAEKQAEWMHKYNVQGYVIQKQDKKVDILIKALNDANLNISLKGKWEQDNNKNPVKNWVNYTSATINNEEILTETVSVWNNQPFKYTLNAKAGETYNIHAEWQKPDTIPEE